MATCLSVATLVLGCIGFFCMCISTGTVAWKEDIDFYRGTQVYIGLWRACIKVENKNEFADFPEVPLECDKDYLRPHLNEPPSWFNSVRSLMLLSCFGTGFGIFFFLVAFITDNSKKTGSKYFPSTLIIFFGGLCALVALCIFAVNRQAGIQFNLAGDKFFADYWTIIEGTAVVNGADYKIETWLRYSYIVGWFGVAFTLFALITALLSDLIRKQF